ncbi:solute carrier family 23 member 1-like [Octopus sinensis]|uniref:Solute carrier family 23 member 1-like n=1 Tax=Octopus sinensis TaxID=2607531 RepID=A0A6P7TE35_9MOLL|nr:solute carrier family 23 member 1-like [Octopus sinensis]
MCFLLSGIEELTSALRMMLRNPTFVGGALACFLDNTIPGTLEERGITTWMPDLAEDSFKKSKQFLKEQDKVYGFSFLPKNITDSWLFAVVPFLPSGRHLKLVEEEDEEEGMELENDPDNDKDLTKA